MATAFTVQCIHYDQPVELPINWLDMFILPTSVSTQACLVAVGETQVWAGSQGIFIIDTIYISCNKTLTEHQDLVTDIVVTENGR